MIGAADELLRMVSVQPYRGGILEAQIPRCKSLMDNTDRFLDFFTAEISFTIQELFCPFSS